MVGEPAARRTTGSRVIMHADVDAFYASVEQRDDKSLQGRPVAVGGSPSHRGVIMTASYEAREFGVRSAMPSRTAMELCPRLTIVPPRFDAYVEASKAIMAIFESRAEKVQPLSLDEAFLDVSDRVGSMVEAEHHAREIKEEVRLATRLTVSLGIAGCRLVAKIASDFEKPNGLTVVPEDGARAFLAPLPVRKLWGVGPKTEARLEQVGIRVVGELAEVDDQWIMTHLGPWGLRLRAMARGIDDSLVEQRAQTKQTSREITFDRDTVDAGTVERTIRGMAESLAKSLKSTGPARTVHIKIRYADFRTITRQRRSPVSVTAAGQIVESAMELWRSHWSGQPIRLVGVGLSSFAPSNPAQLALFEDDG